MKLLIMLLLGYLVYRVFFQPMLQAPNPPQRPEKDLDDNDYTDYEEVD
ncbi:MAG: hypothetical protein KDC34_02055 [Saprospiraceae bacterium]|nr:hypothetical protein [Saprospiraceae bacterium]